MIWATVSSQSFFGWLYRASSSSVAKNIINLISILTIWCCLCEESLLFHWKRVFAMTSVFSWQNFISLWPASFCTPRQNLAVPPGISWLPTFAFQYHIMKRISFWYASSRRSVGLHRSVQLSFSITDQGIDLDYCDIERFALELKRVHLSFLRLQPSTAFQTLFVDYDGYFFF